METYMHHDRERIVKSSRGNDTECPKLIVSRLCSYCGGAVDSIISVSTQLHRSCFNLEFETFHGSIRRVVADLW